MPKLVSIPFNAFNLKGRILGMDSYFWRSLEFEYRRALLIKPVEMLSQNPTQGSIILNPRVSPLEQINDLRSLLDNIESYKYQVVSKFNRWKTARFYSLLLPGNRGLREVDRLSEVISSEVILKNLGLDDPHFVGVRWLNLKVSEDGVYNETSRDIDRVYTGLYRRDVVFSRELRRAAGLRFEGIG